MEDIDIDKIIEKIEYLKALREEVLKSELSPEGAWIHEYQIHRSYPSGHEATYTYAKWQADKPIFKRNPKKNARPLKPDKNEKYTNHQHIGNIENPEVQKAYQAWENRKKLQDIEKFFQNIEAMLYSLPSPNGVNTDDF